MSGKLTTPSAGWDDSSDMSAEARTGQEGASTSNDDMYIDETMLRNDNICRNKVWLAPPKEPTLLCLRAGDVIQYEATTPDRRNTMIVAMVTEV
jgi:hypothetical protein